MVEFGASGVKAPAVYIRVISSAKVSINVVGSCVEKDSLQPTGIHGLNINHAVRATTWKQPLPINPNTVSCHMIGHVGSNGHQTVTVEMRAPEANGPQTAPPVPSGSAPGTVFASAYAPSTYARTGSYTVIPHALYVHVVGTSSMVQMEAAVSCTRGGAKTFTTQGKPTTWKVPLPAGHGGGCSAFAEVLNMGGLVGGRPDPQGPLWLELRRG
jgi:hypothetical protein